jgi:hypothetical protein
MDTMEENLFCCIPQKRKISSIVGYNGRNPAALWDTMRKIFLCWIPQLFCVVLWDTIHRIRFCWGVGYNRRKTPALWDTTEKKLSAILRFFSVVSHKGKTSSIVSHNRRKPSLLYPTMETNFSLVYYNGKNLFRCIPQWQKNLKLK